MKQTELFQPTLPAAIRKSPRLWVKELAFYKTWDPEDLVRRISLRPGLNIIWAEPTKKGAGGHAAGKTTFCRFIRYLLGDTHFGNDTFRDAFRHKFPNAWLVGEVHLDGEPWVIAKFLGVNGPNPWSIRSVTLDQLFEDQPRSSYAEFTRSLKQAFIAPLQLGHYPSSGKEVEWSHVLAWLTRDQEARYSKPLEWRSSDGGHSGMGDITHADRILLVRSVLGIVKPEEITARQEHMTLLKKKNDSESLIPKQEYALRRAEKAYRKNTGVRDDTITVDALESAKSDLNARKTDLENQLRDWRKVDGGGDELPGQFESAIRQCATLEKEEAEAKAISRNLQRELDFKEGRLSDEEYRKELSELPLRADQCSAPLEIAITCEMARILHPNRFSEHQLKQLEKGVSGLRLRCGEAAEVMKQAHQSLASARKSKSQIETRLNKAREEHRTRIETAAAELQKLETQVTEITDLLSLRESYDQERADLKDHEKALVTSNQKQTELRNHHPVSQAQFSELFAATANEILLTGEYGSIKFEADKVELHLDYNDLTSTALGTLRVVIFDIAALFASARESQHHPGFLLHDSPREADLTASIYHRLFEIARDHEAGPDTPFQYIITTTEPPPEKLCELPWLVHPAFSSAEKEKRFLKENL